MFFKFVFRYGSQILTLHEDLQRVAEELDRNVDMLLSHHERDFFSAYKDFFYSNLKQHFLYVHMIMYVFLS